MMWEFVSDGDEIMGYAEGYFQQMSRQDVIARGCSTIGEVKSRYRRSIHKTVDRGHGSSIDHAVRIASNALSGFRNITRIPWRIAILGGDVEMGYPHTHGNIIMLTENVLRTSVPTFLAETLIHEKVHVFQRVFPVESHILIIKKLDFVPQTSNDVHGRRANPDLNGFMYTRDGRTCYQEYASETPRNMSDSRIVCHGRGGISHISHTSARRDYEHPFEMMAYVIARLAMSGMKSEHDDDVTIARWMRTFL